MLLIGLLNYLIKVLTGRNPCYRIHSQSSSSSLSKKADYSTSYRYTQPYGQAIDAQDNLMMSLSPSGSMK